MQNLHEKININRDFIYLKTKHHSEIISIRNLKSRVKTNIFDLITEDEYKILDIRSISNALFNTEGFFVESTKTIFESVLILLMSQNNEKQEDLIEVINFSHEELIRFLNTDKTKTAYNMIKDEKCELAIQIFESFQEKMKEIFS